jgi:hypothetical protein
VNKMEWIKVDDKLPILDYKGQSRPVIIFRECRFNNVVGCFYSDDDGFHTDEGLPYEGVTHWMEMPGPPKK